MYGPEVRDHYITAPQTPLSVPQLTPPGQQKYATLNILFATNIDYFVYLCTLFTENCRQTGVRWLKSRNLLFFRCYIFVGFRNKVDIVVHYDDTPFWWMSGCLPTPIRMTLNDLECLIHLKVRLPFSFLFSLFYGIIGTYLLLLIL